ncbi:hypothetical protein VFPFJ_01473 [Purpureocillium lilacinum]|uniref:Uncharacterized protein n=1 Tax=Purpureocillium lilacinum TaxID=33203 RepID=A0A179I1C7_PURLI|nr:hypothetical protein VFPFJ_01473 [Purpureocillium lilacinum]OAQ95363.1 hypothetical protein VFPFJ_01473 [Purpureocillium lilacinum]
MSVIDLLETSSRRSMSSPAQSRVPLGVLSVTPPPDFLPSFPPSWAAIVYSWSCCAGSNARGDVCRNRDVAKFLRIGSGSGFERERPGRATAARINAGRILLITNSMPGQARHTG